MKNYKILIFIIIVLPLIIFLVDITNRKSKTKESEKMTENQKIVLTINNQKLTATLTNNSSTEALVNKLKKENITIEMEDYANMEKVGDLGFHLPRNDQNIKTNYGDLILYQGTNFVIYYDKNSWSLTKLGKIDNISQEELKNILGAGNVTVTLSLK